MKTVTAAVIVEEGRLFLARRPAGDPLAGAWELPGGKVEPWETAQACLARELTEELAMAVEVGRLLATTVYHYEHGSFEILAYEVTRASDYITLVHDASAWVSSTEIAALELAPADEDLVAQLVDSGVWR